MVISTYMKRRIILMISRNRMNAPFSAHSCLILTLMDNNQSHTGVFGGGFIDFTNEVTACYCGIGKASEFCATFFFC